MVKLEDFIRNFSKRFKIKNADVAIRPDTLIELDLNIFDIDIDMLLKEYSEYYNVSLEQFSWEKYGYPTGALLLRCIKRVFGHNSIIFKCALNNIKHSSLSVEQLDIGINRGFLS